MFLKNINAFQSRIKLFLSLIIDYLIIHIIFYIFNPNKNFLINDYRYYFYFLFWILISYVFDRYYRDSERLEINNFIYQIIKSLKSVFVFGSFFLIFNWILGNYVSRSFLIIFLLNLLIFSSLLQYAINKLILKKFIKFKYWIFVTNKDSNEILDQNSFFNKERIKVININKLWENFEIIINSYGIVLNDLEKNNFNLAELFLEFKKKGVKIYQLSNWLKFYLKRYPPYLLKPDHFLGIDFLILNNSLQMRIKRIGDVFLSIFLLMLSCPLIILFGILIYIEDKGPIFYSQQRNGYLSGKFTIWKLRSMRIDAESKGIKWTSEDDPRITKIGAIIRKTRIDELPQLWSVFIGDMSLIGPRPERPEFDNLLISKIPFYNLRYLLRPGLSGWAQVNYPYGASIEDSTNKLSFDLFYISNYSFWLDLLIFLRTLRLIFNAKGYKPISKTSNSIF